MLPDRLAFPCLALALFGPHISIDAVMLEEALISSLSAHEANVLRAAIRFNGLKFPDDVLSELLQLFGSYGGCRASPNPQNIKMIRGQAARYMCLVHLAAAISNMHMGIPDIHSSFWKDMEVGKLYKIYKCISVSTQKVLNLLV